MTKDNQKPIGFAAPDPAEIGLRMAHVLEEIEALEQRKSEINKEIRDEVEGLRALLGQLGKSLRDSEQMTLDAGAKA